VSSTWGLTPALSAEAKRRTQATAPVRPALAPQQAQAAHKGIVWLHLSAIVVWLFVAGLLGLLLLAGKPVPPVVALAGFGAAAGHGLFLALHLVLAARVRRRS
jgi:hypothetical protein